MENPNDVVVPDGHQVVDSIEVFLPQDKEQENKEMLLVRIDKEDREKLTEELVDHVGLTRKLSRALEAVTGEWRKKGGKGDITDADLMKIASAPLYKQLAIKPKPKKTKQETTEITDIGSD